MDWYQAAIATSATVAVLAGAVTAVAGAVAADQASRHVAGPTSTGTRSGEGASSAYRSRVTITLDVPPESCAGHPDGDSGGPRGPGAPCGVVTQLPIGATEDDVLRALGEPRRRRTLGEGSEAWDYSRYVDEQRYAFASITLTFEGSRLVDSQGYIFK